MTTKDSRDATCGCDCKAQGYTYTPPTKPGYYWIRNALGFENGIVEIVPDGDDLRVQVIGDDWDIELSEIVDAEWQAVMPPKE